MHCQFLSGLFLDLWKLLYVVTLDGVPYPTTLHREIHDLGKTLELYRSRERAIVKTRVAFFRWCAGELHRAHGRHHLLVQDRVTYFGIFALRQLVAKILFHEIDVTIDCLDPSLAELLPFNPTRVGTQVHKFTQRIILEIFFTLFRKLANVLRHISLLLADLGTLRAIKNICLRGRHIVRKHELTLDFVLTSLN